MKSLRVLLVDDNPRFIDSIERYLISVPDIHIDCVGKATSGEDAMKLTPVLNPDLILMDLTMPGINGLDAIRKLKELKEPPRAIILTIHESDEYRWAAKDAGADGFITKSEFTQKLIPLLRSIFPQLVHTPDSVPGDETSATNGTKTRTGRVP